MGIESPLQSVPAEGIGGLGDRRHAAGNGRRLRDPRQRRHPPRPDRDQQSRVPRRQGRRLRERRRRTRPHRGPGLRSDAHPRGRDHPGHRRRLHLDGLLRRRPARPAPRRSTPTPGSSATRRCSRPRSGSATRPSREYTGFGGPTAGPIWANYMSAAPSKATAPNSRPGSLPELEGLDSEHTSSSGYNSYEDEETRRRRRRKRRGEGQRQRRRRRRRRRRRGTRARTRRGTGTRRRNPRPAPAGGGISPG